MLISSRPSIMFYVRYDKVLFMYKNHVDLFFTLKRCYWFEDGGVCIPTQIVSVWESYAPVYVDSCVEVQLCNMQLQFVNRYTAG